MTGRDPEAGGSGTVSPPTSVPIGRPPRTSAHRSLASRLGGRIAVVRRYGIPFFSEFVRDCDTNATVFLTRHNTRLVGKYFIDSVEAQAELEAERRSWALFHDRPWRMPVVSSEGRGLLVRRLPDDARLDMRARTMTKSECLDAGAWALEVIIELYLAGYLHGDLQPHNIWYLEGRRVVTDWSTFASRTPEIPFAESADITGCDPAYQRRFDPAFDPDDPWSFHNVLGISLSESVEVLGAQLASRPARGETDAKLKALETCAPGRTGR
ncbi:MAG TPA: hypothetical protein VIJ18_16985 [Microbacteriaceae bacterium]